MTVEISYMVLVALVAWYVFSEEEEENIDEMVAICSEAVKVEKSGVEMGEGSVERSNASMLRCWAANLERQPL